MERGVGRPVAALRRARLGQSLGTGAAVEFTTAWLLEKSLSVDNLFVFALIFGYFKVPRQYQHRVLFFGVIGALIFRGDLPRRRRRDRQHVHRVLFVFAAILLYSAYKLLKDDDDEFDPGKSIAVRLLRKVVPVRDEYAGTKFFVKEAGKRVATPLLAVVVAIEAADLVFAVDSVPAVLAVSDDPFIVYARNAFAILGLRALYFLLSGMLDKFHYLSQGPGVHPRASSASSWSCRPRTRRSAPSIPEIPSLVSLAVIASCSPGRWCSACCGHRRPTAASPPHRTNDRLPKEPFKSGQSGIKVGICTEKSTLRRPAPGNSARPASSHCRPRSSGTRRWASTSRCTPRPPARTPPAPKPRKRPAGHRSPSDSGKPRTNPS